MIALRKLFQVFGRGTLMFLNPSNRKILAYLRDLDRGDGTHETILCVAYLSRFALHGKCCWLLAVHGHGAGGDAGVRFVPHHLRRPTR